MERFVNCFGLFDMIADMIKVQVSQLMNLVSEASRWESGSGPSVSQYRNPGAGM